MVSTKRLLCNYNIIIMNQKQNRYIQNAVNIIIYLITFILLGSIILVLYLLINIDSSRYNSDSLHTWTNTILKINMSILDRLWSKQCKARADFPWWGLLPSLSGLKALRCPFMRVRASLIVCPNYDSSMKISSLVVPISWAIVQLSSHDRLCTGPSTRFPWIYRSVYCQGSLPSHSQRSCYWVRRGWDMSCIYWSFVSS